MKLTEKLQKLNVCREAIEWCEGKTFKQAWDTCERGDWMLWLAHRKMDKAGWCDLRNLTLAKARCAKLVIHLMKDKRSIKAVEVAERFGNGDATRKELTSAAASAADADAAASAADADAAAYAADDASAYAAYAAYAVAASAYAAYAAYAAAAYAASAYDAYAAYAAYDAYAAYAAYAADAAADAAAAYAAAAYAASAYDAYAAYAAKRKETLSQCADICRATIKVGRL